MISSSELKECLDVFKGFILQDSILWFNNDVIYMHSGSITVSKKFLIGVQCGVDAKLFISLISCVEGDITISKVGESVGVDWATGRVSLKTVECIGELQIDIDDCLMNKISNIDSFKKIMMCTAKDFTCGPLTCMYIKDGLAVSCDNYRAIRCNTNTNINKDILIPRKIVDFIVKNYCNYYYIDEKYAYFKNDTTYIMYPLIELKYPNINHIFNGNTNFTKGATGTCSGDTNIKKGVTFVDEIIDKLGRFELFNTGSGIDVTVGKDVVNIQASNEYGNMYDEVACANNTPCTFRINPKYFREALSVSKKTIVHENKIIFEADDFTHVVALVDSDEAYN